MSSPTIPPASLLQKVKDNWMTIAGAVLGLAALGGAYFYFKGKHTQALAHNPSPPHKRLRSLAEGERGRLWPEAAPTQLEERIGQQGRLPAFDFQDARENPSSGEKQRARGIRGFRRTSDDVDWPMYNLDDAGWYRRTMGRVGPKHESYELLKEMHGIHMEGAKDSKPRLPALSNPFLSSHFAARRNLPTQRNPSSNSEQARARKAARIRS